MTDKELKKKLKQAVEFPDHHAAVHFIALTCDEAIRDISAAVNAQSEMIHEALLNVTGMIESEAIGNERKIS